MRSCETEREKRMADVNDLTVQDSDDLVIALPVSPDEDALLRRLAQFELLGATLATTMAMHKADIRTRDRREAVRLPGEKHIGS